LQITEVIKEEVNPSMRLSVLMGANLAPEVAAGMFCETTIGCTDAVSFPDYNTLHKN
jgi:glycerol-3-phosphate dehydrogenase